MTSHLKAFPARKITAIEGSSSILTFRTDGHAFYTSIKEDLRFMGGPSIFGNFTMHIDLNISNVTSEDLGYYRCFIPPSIAVKLQVASTFLSI